tara:strand:+ start:9937 stop:10536 length:600 start_codon:yes stop_codon:yes gene_type:complete
MLKQFYGNTIEAGCDEAGRGCLAGPVIAAAVILPKNFKNNLINDSKLLNKKDRMTLAEIIKREAICWSIGNCSKDIIDKINILNASFLAMHKAIDKLKIKPKLLLIDGNRFNKYQNILHKCIVKGDSKYISIAAASILAKTHRDKLMDKLHNEFPEYNWKQNKGYPTQEHKLSILNNGLTKYHRRSFNLKHQLKLKFNN